MSAPKASARPSRRQWERDARIAWILDEAMELALAEGIGAVTTPKLAARLDYTVGALYRYFPSIEALLTALHRHTAELFYHTFFEGLAAARASLDAHTADEPPPVRALSDVLLMVGTYGAVARKYPRHFELVAMFVTRDPTWLDEASTEQLDTFVLPRVAQVVSVFARAADEEVAALRPGDAAERAMVLWLGVHACLAVAPLAAKHPTLLDPRRLVRAQVRALLQGWGAEPALLARAEERVVASGGDG